MMDWWVQNGETVLALGIVVSIPGALAAFAAVKRFRARQATQSTKNLNPRAVRKVRSLVQERQSAAGFALLGVDEFFLDNADEGSIAPNRLTESRPVSLREFHSTLQAIAGRPDVQIVLVEATDDSLPMEWPFSQAIYILTSAGLTDVQRWVSPLRPDEVSEGAWHGEKLHFPQLKADCSIYCAWWD